VLVLLTYVCLSIAVCVERFLRDGMSFDCCVEMKKKKWFLALLVCMLFWFLFFFLWHRDERVVEHTLEELKERHTYLYTHATSTPVHPRLRAIRFSEGNVLGACGTALLNGDGSISSIITANHIFSKTCPGEGYYDYHVFGANGYTSSGHISRVILDSMRHSSIPEGIQDIAICYPGAPEKISRISEVCVSAEIPITQNWKVGAFPTPITVTSTITGERFDVVGQAVNDQNVLLFIMLYESMSGESGSGFLGSDDVLYVLSGTFVPSDSMRAACKIPSRYKYASLMSAVKIGW
jgi:hypothetical protein